ncbi:MAG: TrbI/VirB10 family protein [Verrucomicrobia subdivision 3 bacterium]|nr:TrbI/VirB10 family protein [Limisphaerales bacterium]
MKPRDLLNFFKTRSGKLLLFALVFGGGLLVFSAVRNKDGSGTDIAVAPLGTNDRPQTVQTVERPMQPFYPPPPKPEPPPPPPKTNEPPKEVAKTPPQQPPPPAALAPISLLADATAGVPEPRSLGPVYAPFGRLISCETVITVDSASIQTPIIGLVTEDLYHAGKLVIPAGTEVHGSAQTDRQRERIAGGTSWTLVWQSGEELRLKAVALDREFSGDQEGWGITDGSAGLRGRIIKSDEMAEIKLFAATFLSGAAEALTEKQQTIFGPISSPTLNNAPFEGAQKVLSVYAQRIYEAIQRDGFYVRVPSGKQFYLYVLQTVDRADAVIGATFTENTGATTGPAPVPPTVPSAPQPTPLFQP